MITFDHVIFILNLPVLKIWWTFSFPFNRDKAPPYVCFICIYHLWGLPLPEDADTEHPKVKELHELLAWAEGMVWCSPERHGSMSSIFKSQIDWIPLAGGAIRATQGKPLP